MTEFVRMTIAEPFPVLFSHISQKSNRCGEATGPFYAAGSKTYHNPAHKPAIEASAEHIRCLGYTVTVDTVNA